MVGKSPLDKSEPGDPFLIKCEPRTILKAAFDIQEFLRFIKGFLAGKEMSQKLGRPTLSPSSLDNLKYTLFIDT